jgi:hypothetical protein
VIILPKTLGPCFRPPLRTAVLLLQLLASKLGTYLGFIYRCQAALQHFIRYISPTIWGEIKGAPDKYTGHDTTVLILAVDGGPYTAVL